MKRNTNPLFGGWYTNIYTQRIYPIYIHILVRISRAIQLTTANLKERVLNSIFTWDWSEYKMKTEQRLVLLLHTYLLNVFRASCVQFMLTLTLLSSLFSVNLLADILYVCAYVFFPFFFLMIKHHFNCLMAKTIHCIRVYSFIFHLVVSSNRI